MGEERETAQIVVRRQMHNAVPMPLLGCLIRETGAWARRQDRCDELIL